MFVWVSHWPGSVYCRADCGGWAEQGSGGRVSLVSILEVKIMGVVDGGWKRMEILKAVFKQT